MLSCYLFSANVKPVQPLESLFESALRQFHLGIVTGGVSGGALRRGDKWRWDLSSSPLSLSFRRRTGRPRCRHKRYILTSSLRLRPKFSQKYNEGMLWVELYFYATSRRQTDWWWWWGLNFLRFNQVVRYYLFSEFCVSTSFEIGAKSVLHLSFSEDKIISDNMVKIGINGWVEAFWFDFGHVETFFLCYGVFCYVLVHKNHLFIVNGQETVFENFTGMPRKK